MTLFLDSWYTIGKLHLFCEDYVCLGEQPFPYLILADGCSAAPDSDLGARLLALNARRLLPRFAFGRHWRLGRRMIRRAARQARDLGLNEGVLDATLLIAWCAGDAVHVHLYGDGCIITRSVAGAVAAIQVEYAENAPYYLSYLLDAERGALYREAIGDARTGQNVRYLHDGGVTLRQEPFDAPTVFSFNLTTFPTVAVATDGLHSFMNMDTGERVELLEVARQLLDFPNFDAGFVKRRTHEVLAEYGRKRVDTGERVELLEVARRLLDFPNLNAGFVKRRTHEVLVEYGRNRVVNLDDLGWGAFVRVGARSRA